FCVLCCIILIFFFICCITYVTNVKVFQAECFITEERYCRFFSSFEKPSPSACIWIGDYFTTFIHWCMDIFTVLFTRRPISLITGGNFLYVSCLQSRSNWFTAGRMASRQLWLETCANNRSGCSFNRNISDAFFFTDDDCYRTLCCLSRFFHCSFSGSHFCWCNCSLSVGECMQPFSCLLLCGGVFGEQFNVSCMGRWMMERRTYYFWNSSGSLRNSRSIY